jgi:hypothetical protein
VVNEEEGEVALQLGGKEWPLLIGLRATCIIEKALGGKGIGTIIGSQSMSHLVLAIAAGLQHADRKITEKWVMDTLDEDLVKRRVTLEYLHEVVYGAIARGLNLGNKDKDKKEVSDENPELPVLLTGTG